MTTAAYNTTPKRRIFERLFIVATMILGIVAGWISIGFIVRGTELAHHDPVIRELATMRGILFCVAASALAFMSQVMSGLRWTLTRLLLSALLLCLAAYNFASIVVVQVTAAEANNTQAIASTAQVAELEAQLKLYQTQAAQLADASGAIKSTTGKDLTKQEELYGRTLARQAAARSATAASEAAAIKRQLDSIRPTAATPTFATALCRTTDKVSGDPNCTTASYYQYGYEIVGGLILDLISIACWHWAGLLLRREIDVETKQSTSTTGAISRLLRSIGRRLRIGAAAGATAAAALSSPTAQATEPPQQTEQQQEQSQQHRTGFEEVAPCPHCSHTGPIRIIHHTQELGGQTRHYSKGQCRECGEIADEAPFSFSEMHMSEAAAEVAAVARWNEISRSAAHVQQHAENTSHVQHELDAAIAAERERANAAAAALTEETRKAEEQKAAAKQAELEALKRQADALQQQLDNTKRQTTEQQQEQASLAAAAEAGAAEAEEQATKQRAATRRAPRKTTHGMPDTGTTDADGTRYRSVLDAVKAGELPPTEAAISKFANAGRPTVLRYLAAMLQAGVIKPRATGKGYELA